MQLAPTLAKRFNTSVRERGYQYFRQNRVRVRYGSRSELRAEVRGSELYQVVLQWTGSQLELSCTCPHFADHGELCKHLWAAILEADTQNYLSDAASAAEPELDSEILLNELAKEVGGKDAVREVAAAPRSVQRTTPIVAPRPAAWKKQLSQVLHSSAESGVSSGSWEVSWPAHTEILYIVNMARSRSSGHLVLSLEFREPKKLGGWKMRKPLSLPRSRISSLPEAEDREILTALMGANSFRAMATPTPTTGSPNRSGSRRC